VCPVLTTKYKSSGIFVYKRIYSNHILIHIAISNVYIYLDVCKYVYTLTTEYKSSCMCVYILRYVCICIGMCVCIYL